MAVTFEKPIRPGTRIRFVGETLPTLQPSLADIVAIPGPHDYGPEEPKLITRLSEFDALYGNSDTAGRRAVILALNGQGESLGPGAGGVLFKRMVTSAGAVATINIANTAGSPVANALKLDAKYKGTRGARISYSIGDDPTDNTRDVLAIYFDGVRVERYIYTATDIAGLAAMINARSQYVKATSNATGTALAATNPADLDGTPLNGGNDGTSFTGTEWTNAMTALEFERFSIIAPYDLGGAPLSTVRAAFLSWVRTMADNNRPVILVLGGAAGETIDDALARSAAMADPHVVNLGVGTYRDEMLARNVSTAELAPRIAGVLAARGEEKSLTFAKLSGLTVVGDTNPDNSEIEDAIEGGVTVLSRATSSASVLRIEKGVTTFTQQNDAARPYDVFGDPRLVRVMDLYTRGMKEWGDDNIIGGTVNQDSRDAVRAEARRRQDDLEERGIIITNTGFVNVPIPSDPVLADAIPYDFGWQFARTANYVFGDGRIR